MGSLVSVPTGSSKGLSEEKSVNGKSVQGPIPDGGGDAGVNSPEEVDAANAYDGTEDISMRKDRFFELNHALHRIARLQREATAAQINARQSRQTAVLKRQNVWFCDEKLMREVQSLSARGQFTAFDELTRLATACQTSRDGLGPVEQENIEAERRWEGQIWKLQNEEEELLAEFADEFQAAETHSLATTSSRTSRQSETSADISSRGELDLNMPDIDDFHHNVAISVASSTTNHFRDLFPTDSSVRIEIPYSQESTLPDLVTIDNQRTVSNGNFSIKRLSFEAEDICGPLEQLPSQDSFGPGVPLPPRNYASIEDYPQLLSDFSSGRDRINRWIMNTALMSRLEVLSLVTGLTLKFEAECRGPIPSNWAQLVVAFWELDGAAIPSFSENKDNMNPAPKVNTLGKASGSGNHSHNIELEKLQTSELVPSAISSNSNKLVANPQGLGEIPAGLGIVSLIPEEPAVVTWRYPSPHSSIAFQQSIDVEIDHEKVLEKPP